MAYQLKTTNIKGKEYVQVNERIIALRKLPEYKGFSIETEMVAIDSDMCVMKATIRDGKGAIAATGFAQEDRSSSMINKTSYVENCETSAVGRALGFLGIGVESSIATAEEVSLAIAKQDMPTKPTASAKVWRCHHRGAGTLSTLTRNCLTHAVGDIRMGSIRCWNDWMHRHIGVAPVL
jgi:hypothetical protein